MGSVLMIVGGVLIVSGAFIVLGSAVAMLRARDAYTTVSMLTPAVGVGMPFLIIGSVISDMGSEPLTPTRIVMTLITASALVIVSSIGSNALARAAYLVGAPMDPRTDPQDLARER